MKIAMINIAKRMEEEWQDYYANADGTEQEMKKMH
jgi:hypothetical protein